MTVVRKKRPTRELKISTPRNRAQKWLAEAGIVVPEDIPADEESVPLDFTRLSSRGIGALQSRYAVRHSHAVYRAALLESDILGLKRELRIAQAKFRILHRGTPKNVVDALFEENDEIADLLDKIQEIEAKHIVLDAVVKTYEGIRNAASREISRRIGERAPLD
jgi:hypothetical protein